MLTSRSISKSSTSLTSHQLGILHSGPNKPGLMTKYALNSAVSTTWSNLVNRYGVKDDKGALGSSNRSSTVASDKNGN